MSAAGHSAGAAADSPPAPVSLREALSYWLKLGFVSFGGPAGQISMMHTELVERRRWISERRFLHALNYCMVLPGPEAQQLATYIGWLMHRTWGGFVAGGLFVLPSFFILVALTWIYLAFGQVPAVAGFLYGIKPAVTAIVVFAAYRIGSRALKNAALWVIAAAAFVAIFFFNVPFPAIVLTAGIIGYAGGRFAPANFSVGGGHGAAAKRYGVALIDDDTPSPSHARRGFIHFMVVLAVFVALWAVALAAVIGIFGWDGAYSRMGWFFTKAALLTFGGAYAVLPYVYQGGVETYGWLSPTQMIDGLALGETTPGPLIMIVTFVGFVGGWTKEVFGPDALFLAGLGGAAVATLFTFLPSFLLILVGGPLVESTHGNVKLTAPLTGITAAVVGVILNLAAFFAWHVLWPKASANAPFSGPFDWFALVVTITALAVLHRFKAGMIPVILACGAAGLASYFVRPV
ncbi:MAG: chromate efflux transporter [Betaproteobacteria bacterium]|jgi:chromate transporter|nr:chromate efflux transporter [Betaproteobacteria bacterium]